MPTLITRTPIGSQIVRGYFAEYEPPTQPKRLEGLGFELVSEQEYSVNPTTGGRVMHGEPTVRAELYGIDLRPDGFADVRDDPGFVRVTRLNE